MKKFFYLLLLFIMFIPVVVCAEECDTSKVTIASITLDQANNAKEESTATVNGNSINLNLNMYETGDSLSYRIVIKNDSNEDYTFDKNSINISSDYIDYVIESNDNSNIIKAKTAKAVYLNVIYKNPVPEDAYENGSFSDKVTMKVNLSSDGKISNPNTGVAYIIFISFVVFLMAVMLLVFKKKKKVRSAFFIIGLSLLVPISVNALCRCEFQINSTIKIEHPIIEVRFMKCEFGEFASFSSPLSDYKLIDKTYKVRKGMTMDDVFYNDEFRRLNPTYRVGDWPWGSAGKVFPIEFYQCIHNKEYIERYSNMSDDDLIKYNTYWDNFDMCYDKQYDYSIFGENINIWDIEDLPLLDSSKAVYYYNNCSWSL